MNVQLGQQVKVVDSAKPQTTLFVAHVSRIYKDGGFIAQDDTNEVRFTRDGIQYGKSSGYNGQKILYAYSVS
jgi:hypothetical protein